METSPQLAIRVNPANRDHHLWNNHGTWWCHFTLHLPDCTKRRLRRSLRTACLDEARALRDNLLLLNGQTLPSLERPNFHAQLC